jgi:hypothetical protein
MDVFVGAAAAGQLLDRPLGAQSTGERFAEPLGVGVG